MNEKDERSETILLKALNQLNRIQWLCKEIVNDFSLSMSQLINSMAKQSTEV